MREDFLETFLLLDELACYFYIIQSLLYIFIENTPCDMQASYYDFEGRDYISKVEP